MKKYVVILIWLIVLLLAPNVTKAAVEPGIRNQSFEGESKLSNWESSGARVTPNTVPPPPQTRKQGEFSVTIGDTTEGYHFIRQEFSCAFDSGFCIVEFDYKIAAGTEAWVSLGTKQDKTPPRSKITAPAGADENTLYENRGITRRVCADDLVVTFIVKQPFRETAKYLVVDNITARCSDEDDADKTNVPPDGEFKKSKLPKPGTVSLATFVPYSDFNRNGESDAEDIFLGLANDVNSDFIIDESQLILGEPQKLSDGLSFTIGGMTNGLSISEYSYDLLTWIPFSTNLLSIIPTLIVDTSATNGLQKFYRALAPPDITPPTIESIEFESPYSGITVNFNEELDPAAIDLSNFDVSGGDGSLSATDVTLQPNGSSILVDFNTAATVDVMYTLALAGVTDLHGNVSPRIIITFYWYLIPE